MIKFVANFTQPGYNFIFLLIHSLLIKNLFIFIDFYKIADKTKTSQFVTIPFSHYVEFSRWCLQYTKYEYKESGYAPVAHILPALKVRMFSKNGLQLSSSARMIQPGTTFKNENQKNKKGSTALPLLVLPNGEVLKDSWEIAKYSGLNQKLGSDFQNLLDEDIGPLSRQLAYFYMLKKSNRNVCNQFFTNGTGWLWTILWYSVLQFFAKPMLMKEFQSNNTIELNNCKAKLASKINEIDNIINNKTTKYLSGDTPGIDDFSLASLFSPLISPQEYALGRYNSSFNLLEKQDKEYLVEVTKWRNTVTGKYCLMLYREFRTKSFNF
jgi:glutathione S-transferase